MTHRFYRRFVALLLALWGGLPISAAESHSTNSPAVQDLKKFQVGAGLKIELFAAEPLLLNPVAFSIADDGRVYVAESHRWSSSVFDITANTPWLLDDLSFRTVHDRAAFLARTFTTNFTVLTNASELIRLVEDRNGDGIAETASVFATGFNDSVSGTAAGVLAEGRHVWFTSIPDLWRFDAPALPSSPPAPLSPEGRLATGLGVHISVSGHDVHGLIRGPDGRIYFSFGDRGVCVTNREGRWLNVPDTGGVLRCEPDGRQLEIFCIGLRNPQELAFDDSGNLWTVDNDTAGADPCRVLHLVAGGDYGWRGSYQHMKGFGPWVSEELWRGGLDGVLPPAGTVSQGPAGLAFHPGTGLGDRLSRQFVHADFPGGIWAYSVQPRASSYAVANKEKLLWNCWPTDVDFGPDGALYVLDWVQGWTTSAKGRIYRLTTANADPRPEETAETRRLLRQGPQDRKSTELLPLLGHRDRRVRLKAQWELASRGRDSLAPLLRTALESSSTLQRLHALWGISQTLRQEPVGRGPKYQDLNALLPLLEATDPEVRGQAALVLGDHMGPAILAPLVRRLEDPSASVQRLALEALNRHGQKNPASPSPVDPRALQRVLDRNSSDPFVAHAGLDLLLRTPSSLTIASSSAIASNAPTPLALALVRAYRRAQDARVAAFLSHSNPLVVLEAARAINDQPVPAAYPDLAQLLAGSASLAPDWGQAALTRLTPAGPFSAQARAPREQLLLRALNASYRLGGPAAALALARFASGSETASLRAEALFLLGAWEVLPGPVGHLPIKPNKDPNHGAVPTVNPENWPGWFDRVVGLWRPIPPREADPARDALAPLAARLVADSEIPVGLAALGAVAKLHLTAAAEPVLQRLRDPRASPKIRQRVPAVLAELQSPLAGTAVEYALNDPDAEVRAAALPHLDRLQGDRAATILGGFIQRALPSNVEPTLSVPAGDPLRLAQAALAALRTVRSLETDQLLHHTLTRLLAREIPPALELDVLEAAGSRGDHPGIASLLARWSASLSPTNELAFWRPALAGGDALRGRALFFEKVEVQCSRCHRVKQEGGIVGPALDGVGSRQTRDQLLESILRPNRVIAPGYESVLLTMKNGAEHAGLVKSESASELRLESPEEGMLTLRSADISERRRSLSAMPEDLGRALTRRELRDLIEFLAALK